MPKLCADVLVLADNALSHPDEIAGYLEAIRKLQDFQEMIVPVGKGLSVAYRGSSRPSGRPSSSDNYV